MMELNKIIQSDHIKTAGMTELFMIKNLFKKHVQNCMLVDCYCKEVRNESSIDGMSEVYRLLALNLMSKFTQKFE